MDLYYYETGYIDNNYFVYTADAAATPSVDSSMTIVIGKIQEAQIDVGVLFTSSMTAIVFKNESSAMASTFSFTSSIDVNRSANITLDNIIALSSQAVKTSDDSADLSFAASQTAAAQRTLDGSSSLTEIGRAHV